MKILIVGADDVVTNLSATPFLGQWASDAGNKIDMLISVEQIPFFITNPDITKIFRVNGHFCNRWWGSLIYRANILKALMAMRQENFDCIISFSPVSINRYRLWKLLLGVKHAGYFRDNNFVTSYLNKTENVSYPDSEKAENLNASLKLYPDLQSATVMVRRYCISLTSSNIGIIINSASSVNWTSVQWASLIRKLSSRGRVFLISAENNSVSGNEDKTLMAEAQSLCSDGVVTMVVVAKTADFIAMISLCSGLISADSDAVWVAASMRVPVIYPDPYAVKDIPPGCKRVSCPNAEKVFNAFVSNTDSTS
ncbi:ADP-heptose:LPS heptosyltransferase-like protein [Pantoea vagans]|uniref:glycosyltransferase family 9 protein n=1 Tax=Pantoea vagans TaxID=470934 RepID=UPI00320B7FC7